MNIHSTSPSPRSPALAILVLVAAAASPPVCAEAGDAWLVLPPEIVEGETFVAELHADLGVQAYAASQFELTWDASLLEIDPSHGILGVSGGPGRIGEVPPVVVNTQDLGVLIVNAFLLGSQLSGEVLLHGVGFRALAPSGLAAITLVVDTLGDAGGTHIPDGAVFPLPGVVAEAPLVPAPPPLCGDVDDDGDVDIIDTLLVAQAALGSIELDPTLWPRADVDADGDTDILDAFWLARHALGLGDPLVCVF